MPPRIILLSGSICTGKTELAKKFVERYSATIFKTSELLKTRIGDSGDLSRSKLQESGEALDKKDGGRWVSEALASEINRLDVSEGIVLVDSIRIRGQARHIRKTFGSNGFGGGSQVFHIHLTACRDVLEKRYKKRLARFREFDTYEAAAADKTESQVEGLAEYADVLVPTDGIGIGDVFIRASAHLNLYPRTAVPLVDVLVGGQYGSEGKGHIAAHIAPEYDCLMRVGGPNAGHKVYEKLYEKKDIKTFHHLPSGTMRNQNAIVILGAGSMIRLEVLMNEIQFSQIEADRLFIDNQATIIENRDVAKEQKRLVGKISSTGQGVGAATARKILERDPDGSVRLAKDVPELKPFTTDTVTKLESLYQNNSRVLLEGTQGTSLSLHHGEYPWVTSRDTTVSGCIAEAGISPRRIRKVILVCRTYPIRVGGPSGPMKNEISRAELSRRSGIPYGEVKRVEKTSTTNKIRRIGEFDWEQLQRSVVLNGPTEVALSFADYLAVENRKAHRFEKLHSDTIKFIEEVERVSGVPVSLISTGFDYRSIIDRRAW